MLEVIAKHGRSRTIGAEDVIYVDQCKGVDNFPTALRIALEAHHSFEFPNRRKYVAINRVTFKGHKGIIAKLRRSSNPDEPGWDVEIFEKKLIPVANQLWVANELAVGRAQMSLPQLSIQ